MTPAPWSIRRRLMFTLGAATLLSWCASSLWLYHTASEVASQMFDAALDHTAHAVLAVVRNEASELTETKEGIGYELGVIDQSDQNDIVYQVRGPNGVVVFRSHGAPIEPLAAAHDRGFGYVRIQGKDYRVFTVATELDAATIHVAQPVARRTELTRAGAVRLLAPGAALMLALVLAVAWSVRRTTDPLVGYASALDHLDIDTGATVDGSRLPQELQPVSVAIDRLLARVHDSLVRERTLTADAAHELRTPLTALRLQAQVALRAKDRAESNTALAELLASTDRTARMVDSMLTLARLDAHTGFQVEKRTVKLGELAELLRQEFAPFSDLRHITVAVNFDGSEALGDEDALAIVLRNLISNALRFARTRIAIDITGQDDQVRITVRDDGPGFSEDSAQRAFHRFYRGAEAGRPSDGAGLGLALVLRIMQLHGGTVQIVAGINGGAGVELQLARNNHVAHA